MLTRMAVCNNSEDLGDEQVALRARAAASEAAPSAKGTFPARGPMRNATTNDFLFPCGSRLRGLGSCDAVPEKWTRRGSLSAAT